LTNFHRFLNSPEIVQALAKQISTGKQNRTFIVVLSAVVQIPTELEKHFVVLDHDLPSKEQRQKIWSIYLKLFDLDADQAMPNDQQWTGAEIKACCRLAALLDLPLTAAAQNVVPVAVTAAESLERLRSWASGRCLDAECSGIYQSSTPSKPSRKLRRTDPSNN